MSVKPKISCRRVAPTNRSSSQKTMMNGLSCGISILAQVSFVLSLSTRLTDRQRDDGKTDRKAMEISCVALHAMHAKIIQNVYIHLKVYSRIICDTQH